MNQDLKIIKKKYGEKMMHLCRDMFPIILETEGALSQILLEKFEPSRFLYDDIIQNEIKDEFKSYIYNVFDDSERKEEMKIEKTPEQLMSDAGYILYECKTEEDIQRFRKYYKKDEELCTFKGGRLDNCYVYFAVKKDAEKLKREDFKNPKREDLYGTSVISIQFTKDESHVLSIKNRYNHTVSNPDATFSNNLDNIMPELTDSFELYYGMKQQFKSEDFEIKGYVMANDGKYYKYNYEINNIYYCPDNIIIDNFEVKKYPKEKYIILDYFILDLKTGEISLYDEKIKDSFIKSMDNCGMHTIYKENDCKKIIFNKEGQEAIVTIIDKLNNIVVLKNNNIEEVEHGFLYFNKKLEKLEMNNLKYTSYDFLSHNEKLTEINLPKVKEIGSCFLQNNEILKKINLPDVEKIYRNFLKFNKELTEINLPKVKEIGYYFLRTNRKISKVNIPNVQYIGGEFLYYAVEIEELYLQKVKEISRDFMYYNIKLKKISLPNVEKIDENFLYSNSNLKELDLPNVQKISSQFLYHNENMQKISMPNVESIYTEFLYYNKELIEIEIPNLKRIYDGFLYHNEKLEKLDLPNLEETDYRCLINNLVLNELNVPKLNGMYPDFLKKNIGLKRIYVPNIDAITKNIIKNNPNLEIIIVKDKQYKK